MEEHVPTEIPKKRLIPEVVINPPKRGKMVVEKQKLPVVEIPGKLKK